MTYEEFKKEYVAGKFVVVKMETIDADFGICVSMSGKYDYGVFEIEDYKFNRTSFKAYLNPCMPVFYKRAWYTSDLADEFMNDPYTGIFNTKEDAFDFLYVMKNNKPKEKTSSFAKIIRKIKMFIHKNEFENILNF